MAACMRRSEGMYTPDTTTTIELVFKPRERNTAILQNNGIIPEIATQTSINPGSIHSGIELLINVARTVPVVPISQAPQVVYMAQNMFQNICLFPTWLSPVPLPLV